MKTLPSSRLAFTLVEMLIVIAVIALLAGLLLPTLSKSKERARQMQSIGNAREISKAILMYALDHRNTLPDIEKKALSNNCETGKVVIDYLGGDKRVFESPADRSTAANEPSYWYPASDTTSAGIRSIDDETDGTFKMTRIRSASSKAIAYEACLDTDQTDPEDQWYSSRDGGGVVGFADGRADMVRENYTSVDTSHEYY